MPTMLPRCGMYYFPGVYAVLGWSLLSARPFIPLFLPPLLLLLNFKLLFLFFSKNKLSKNLWFLKKIFWAKLVGLIKRWVTNNKYLQIICYVDDIFNLWAVQSKFPKRWNKLSYKIRMSNFMTIIIVLDTNHSNTQDYLIAWNFCYPFLLFTHTYKFI